MGIGTEIPFKSRTVPILSAAAAAISFATKRKVKLNLWLACGMERATKSPQLLIALQLRCRDGNRNQNIVEKSTVPIFYAAAAAISFATKQKVKLKTWLACGMERATKSLQLLIALQWMCRDGNRNRNSIQKSYSSHSLCSSSSHLICNQAKS